MPDDRDFFLIAAVLLVTAVSVFVAVYQFYKRRKMYKMLDEMLEQVLKREPIAVSDVQEGEISALANQLIRIQEKLAFEMEQAVGEKEQIKSMISNLSHQLKTPISNLVMYRDLLEEEAESSQQKMFLMKMGQQMDRLDWILQSLFNMVKLEQGVIQFECGKYSIKNTILEAVNAVYDKAEKKKIQIVMEPFTECKLFHNRKWTAEAIGNILENAIKYSEENSQIKIEVLPLELFTEIGITDSGIGIRKEELTDIFKRFYRCKEVENKEGSGIGLYLSKLILEKEKGYMTAASEYGKGSRFSIFLQNCQK